MSLSCLLPFPNRVLTGLEAARVDSLRPIDDVLVLDFVPAKVDSSSSTRSLSCAKSLMSSAAMPSTSASRRFTLRNGSAGRVSRNTVWFLRLMRTYMGPAIAPPAPPAAPATPSPSPWSGLSVCLS
eukprot:CAMPEP_0202095668 /NCGR_PEP_ID=MMETSP0965-20130614/125_1 /ASSEMBLY_ACC=CAM_ASM_000507 /TAXON_ID=4773 /ORGANISM="Schizochytrium aggregatum, Strain ATCC28209" /LENGTH=125 /DNA_ID=CAMNT_0048663945 /DNA_START=25 /DNA_END=400 /DNA_ORIENTATION=+